MSLCMSSTTILLWYSRSKKQLKRLTCIPTSLEVKTDALAFIPVGTRCFISVSTSNKENTRPLYIEVH